MYIGGLNAQSILYQPTLGWLLFIELSKIYTNILCKMIIYTLTLLATCVMIELVSKSFFCWRHSESNQGLRKPVVKSGSTQNHLDGSSQALTPLLLARLHVSAIRSPSNPLKQ